MKTNWVREEAIEMMRRPLPSGHQFETSIRLKVPKRIEQYEKLLKGMHGKPIHMIQSVEFC